MPTYLYTCLKCEHKFDVIKRVADIDNIEPCLKCAGETRRCLTPVYFTGASDWDKAEFNPGLGIITKNAKHRDREAKARGLIEVGNEDIDRFSAAQDKKVKEAQDEAFEKAFEPAAKELYKAATQGGK